MIDEEKLAVVFKSLSSEVRVHIVKFLKRRAMSVAELTSHLSLSQPDLGDFLLFLKVECPKLPEIWGHSTFYKKT
jgi:predicted transcriptional regulator